MSATALITALTQLRPVHLPSLLCLYEQYFGKARAARFRQRWHWQYVSNPFCAERPPFLRVGLNGEKVVAHMGGFPLPLRIHGRRQIALCGADLVVHQDYRWLALSLVEDFAKQAPVFGTSMSPPARRLFAHFGARALPLSRQRFLRRLSYEGAICRRLRAVMPSQLGWIAAPRVIGWIARPSLRVYTRARGPHSGPVAALDSLRRSHDIRPLKRFGSCYDALWSAVSHKNDLTLDKTATYMNWRYVDQPGTHFLRLAAYARDGRLWGVAVGVPYMLRDRFGRACGVGAELTELIVDNPNSSEIGQLALAAIREFEQMNVEVISTTGLHRDHHPLLCRLGFHEEFSDRYLMALILGDDQDLAPNGSMQHYLTAGDGDALYGVAL